MIHQVGVINSVNHWILHHPTADFPKISCLKLRHQSPKKGLGDEWFLLTRPLFRGELSFPFRKGTPRKINGWNLRIQAPWKRKIIESSSKPSFSGSSR